MALRYATSFDNVQASDASTFFSSSTVYGVGTLEFNASYSRQSAAPIGKGLRLTSPYGNPPGGSYVRLILDAQPTWVMGAAFKMASTWGAPGGGGGTQDAPIFALLASGNSVFELRTTVSGAFIVSRAGTLVGSAGATISTTQFNFVEFKVVIHPTAGSYEVRVNGSTYLSGSGLNTSGTGGTTADTIQLGGTSSPTAGGYAGGWDFWYDDMYLANGIGSGASIRDFVGDCRPYELLPNANGTLSDWSQIGGTGGSPYTAVNDTPNDGDTSYLSSGTIAQRTTLRYPAAPAGTVKAVILAPWLRKDDANSHTVAARMYRGGTESTSAQSIQPTAAYGTQQIVMETDPQTSAAWSVANLNASEFGPVLVS